MENVHFSILIFLVFWGILGLRTTAWWLQNWQIREYRWYRMWAHIRTKDGLKNVFNLWFFRGIFPRPKISGRLILIGLIFLGFSYGLWYFVGPIIGVIFVFILWERTIFLWVGLSVFLSGIPVYFVKRRLYTKAHDIMKNSNNVVVIGITGSFGKSSTKEILVHLLRSKYGDNRVLFTPENQNNEVAIARLVIQKKNFFIQNDKKRFFVVEIGAYREGEIKSVCDFVMPRFGIITGINAQHLSLFGSQDSIQRAKFELAENTREKVFFNTESPLLLETFRKRKISAISFPISQKNAKQIKACTHHSEFKLYGQIMYLPWGGRFFISNAMLALAVARDCGIKPKEMAEYIPKLPPLARALSIQKKSNGVVILRDVYSANPNGVIVAIKHLSLFSGKKIFVGMPLLELGKDAENIHEEIFQELGKIDAKVFWMKDDFSDLGLKICGENYYGQNLEQLKKLIHELKDGDAILLESKLPKKVEVIFF